MQYTATGMVNEEIARIFDRMAKVLTFKGGNRFRIMAYGVDSAIFRVGLQAGIAGMRKQVKTS